MGRNFVYNEGERFSFPGGLEMEKIKMKRKLILWVGLAVLIIILLAAFLIFCESPCELPIMKQTVEAVCVTVSICSASSSDES